MEPDEEKQVLFAADTVSLSKHPEWQATQVFHTNEPPQTEDIDQITSVEFSRDGEHIAVGDRGGRIWIYSTNNGRNRCKPKSFTANTLESDERKIELENIANNDHNNINKSMVDRGLVYDFYGQFQSHQPEFDYLKSLEIEEKINCISWCKCANNSLSLLACNDKTIKLWKVFEKSIYKQSGHSFQKKFNDSSSMNTNFHGFEDVQLPKIECDDIITAAISRRIYQNGHKFHIHSLDINVDCETFISADDLFINLWHFDNPATHFNLCNLKPDLMENLITTISKAILHPLHCNIMAYTTTQSRIYLCDMRQNCQISNNNMQLQMQPANDMLSTTKMFEYQQPLMSRDFFTDIAGYLSDVKFSNNGENIITRDYFNIYVWDIRNNDHPYKILPVHPYFASDLKNLYESDLIFDKFECIASVDGNLCATGTYNNSFVVCNYESMTIEKCILNRNQVQQWQNRMKKKQKRAKKRMKKRLKNEQKLLQKKINAGNAMNEDISADVESNVIELNEKKNDNNEEIKVEDESVDVCPAWLKESYFQKGNFDQKVLQMSYHPNKNVIAAVSGPSLFLFQKLNNH